MSRAIAKSQHTIAIVCGNRLRLRMGRRYRTPHVLALLDRFYAKKLLKITFRQIILRTAPK